MHACTWEDTSSKVVVLKILPVKWSFSPRLRWACHCSWNWGENFLGLPSYISAMFKPYVSRSCWWEERSFRHGQLFPPGPQDKRNTTFVCWNMLLAPPCSSTYHPGSGPFGSFGSGIRPADTFPCRAVECVVSQAAASPVHPQAHQSPLLTVKEAVMALNALYPFRKA